MIFLIDYDRRAGRIVQMRRFDDTLVQEALNERLNLELDLKRRGIDREVVLLDAPNEQALRKTHGRYFQSAQELAQELNNRIG